MKSLFAPQFKSRAFKSGGYSTLISLFLIAVLVAVNLIVGEIPTRYTKFDTTNNQLYTLSEQSKKIAKGIEEEVTIYLIAETGSEDSILTSFLERYAELNTNIMIVYKDPLLYPTFVSDYTDEDLNANSLIIESDKRSKVIDYSAIFVSSIDYKTYTQTWEFNGESEITSAISYVSSAELPKMYTLSGHGERSLSDTIKSLLSSENIELASLSLINTRKVPDDCDCLLIVSPESDVSSDEVTQIQQYLVGGGRLVVLVDLVENEMPNLGILLTDYGVALTEGVVIEGESDYHHWQSALILLPTLSSHDITDPITNGGYMVLMPLARGITTLDTVRASISIEKLLVTSSKAYAQVYEGQSSFDKKEGDTDGPFALAVAITEEYDDTETKIIIFSTSYFINDNYLASGNADMFINSLSWMVDKEDSISIRSKDLTIEYLSITSGASTKWTIVMCVVLPLSFMAAGSMVWYKRRKR